MPVPARRVVLGLFLLTLVFHLSVIWQDFDVLAKNGFLYDDSFYAFKIASNIAAGNGASFDGIHPTNGFQPLYVFLLVPVFWLFRPHPIAPIYGALVLSAVLTALTSVALFGVVRRYARTWIATLVALVWAFAPVVTRQGANGLETSLAAFFFAVVVYFYIARVRSQQDPPRRDFLILGVLMGLAVLARVDEIFLVLAILLDYLLLLRRNGAPHGLRNVLTGLGSGLVVYSPWLLYNVFSLRTFVQDSGAATRFLSQAYAPFFDTGSSEMINTGPNASFLWGHVLHSLTVLKVAPPLHPFFRALDKLGFGLGASDLFITIANIVGICVIAYFGYQVLLSKAHARSNGITEVRFLLVFTVALLSAYSLYVFGLFFFIRYYYPIYFVICVYAAFFLEWAARWLRARPVVVRALATFLFVGYLGGFAYMAYTAAYRSKPVYYFYDIAKWVEANTSGDDTIGVFQGGAIGYLSSRKVINLDGKVNRDALDALKQRRLASYLVDQGVDVVMDNVSVLELFLDRDDLNGSTTLGLNQIMKRSNGGVPTWAAYRLNPSIRASGAALTLPNSPSGTR